MPRAIRPQILPKMREQVIAEKGRHCIYCGKGPLYKRQLHLDHIVSFKDGGKNSLENLFPCCATCNTKKGSKSVADYADRRIPALERELALLRALRAVYGAKR